MGTKTVVVSSCDRCSFEETHDLPDKRRGDPYILPPGWLHVAGNTATTTVFELDLCSECKGVVLEAAGAARR